MKKNKILIIICLALFIIAGGLLYWRAKTTNQNRENNRAAFETGFIMLDDEKTLVWSEETPLSPDAKAKFQKRAEEVRADLDKQTNNGYRLADFNNLGLYEYYLGNYREAYNAYLESLKLENSARIAWQNFADVLLNIKAYKSAEMAYKKAVDLNKYIPESYVKLANYYQAVGDDKKTEQTYKTALDAIKGSTENDTLVLSDYARWLADKKRYNEAIEIYQKLEVKQPNNKAAIEREIEKLKNK